MDHSKQAPAAAVAADPRARMRERQIDAFLDDWNFRRQGHARPSLFRPRSAERELALVPATRLRYRRLIGEFIDRFRPDRRDFRRRTQQLCRDGHALDDLLLAGALSEMAIEALKRHLGVAMSDDRDGQRSLLLMYEMQFLPAPTPMSSTSGDIYS